MFDITETGAKKIMTIQVTSKEEQIRLMNDIAEQLHGNQDYIDNNILLSIDVENTVELFIFNECKEENIPKITIKF